jgi:osmotically-inducible protein OsmY
MKTDFDIQRDVQEELYWNPRVNAPAIGVAVNDGIVTLTGQVPQFAERKAAVRSAQRVAGVKGVVDHLEVHLASAGERTDAEIAHAALNVLAWNSFVPAANIRVTVHGGWLTLAGDVEWQYQRVAAEDAVHALWGVRGVTNTITVRSRIDADIVKDTLESALRRRARLHDKKIGVEVHGQKVILSGHVDSLDEWEEADAIAWETPGVFAVDNQIIVAFWNIAS